MKTKILLLVAALCAVAITRAQITPSITIPNPLPNYDGSYDDFGTNHLYYPNDGEIRYANKDLTDAIAEVKFYTMNTYPKKYLLSNNNLAYVHYKPSTTSSTGPDSLQRIDFEWLGSNASAFLARVDTQNFAQLNYFTQWFGPGGRTNVKGGAAIACQSIYNNIDLVYTSNNAGMVMYFIIYPGGSYNTIRMHLNGSTANSIVSSQLKIDANWEYSTLEKPQMYQYALSGGVITPVNVGTADWQNIGTDTYGFYSTSSYNSSLPLIIQIRQATPLTIHTAGMKWSTYFGGSQFDFLTKTHCDGSDNLYVAGYTSATGFPQNQGAILNSFNTGSGVISRFNTSGVLRWSVFTGGSGNDEIHDFDFVGDSIVYCVGKTSSTNLSTFTKTGASPNDATLGASGWDGFILEFQYGQLNIIQPKWYTYYGGNGDDELNGVKFDSQGNMFVVGASASTDLSAFGPSGSYQQSFNSAQLSQLGTPATIAITDGILAKFDAGTSANSWFTFYGTDALSTNANSYSGDFLYGLAINGTDLYACGKAGGTNLPNSFNSKLVNGNFDGILAHFTTSGVLASNSSKYTNGNIANYSVKTLSGDVYTVGETDNTLLTTNSSAYYFNGTAAGSSDGCFSVHSSNLASTIHNSFLGGNASDAAYDIQIMPNNQILISGGTTSSDFPTFNLTGPYNNTGNPNGAVWPADNFISCLAVGNTNLVWSTYLGSQYSESLFYPSNMNTGTWPQITTMAVTSANGLYALGVSNSYNTFPLDEWNGFPTYFQGSKAGMIQGPGGTNDGTITRIDMTALGETTGLKDFKNTEFVFGFYPNPTSKTLSITNKALVNDELSYAVYDIGGKKLQEGKLKAGDVKDIDVSSLPEGMYIINVSNGKTTYSNKFIKVNN